VSAPDSSIHVDTTNAHVQSLIESTARILIDHGATINPNISILESDGHLSVHYPGAPAGATLFVIPKALLIPVSEITWGITQDAHSGIRSIEIKSTADLTPVQRDLLELLVDLYNTAGKFEWFLTEHPRSALSQFPDVEDLLKQCQPNYSHDQSIDGFLATRVLGYRDKSSTEKTRPRTPVLMPLVELMNHHSHGAPFDMNDGSIKVLANQPAGNSECFANYGGMLDALQMFINYGFADESALVSTSTPATIPLIGGHPSTRLGTLVVKREQSNGHLPLITAHGSTLTLSKVTFSPSNPDRFNAAFTLPVKAFALQQGASSELADQIAEQASCDLIDLNQQQLGELLTSVVSLGSERAVIRELESALRVQLRNIDNFSQR
jgi:hypothetical protein